MGLIYEIFLQPEQLLRVALMYCGIRIYLCIHPRQLCSRSLLTLTVLPSLSLLKPHLNNFFYVLISALVYIWAIIFICFDMLDIYKIKTTNLTIKYNKPKFICRLCDIVIIAIFVASAFGFIWISGSL